MRFFNLLLTVLANIISSILLKLNEKFRLLGNFKILIKTFFKVENFILPNTGTFRLY